MGAKLPIMTEVLLSDIRLLFFSSPEPKAHKVSL